MFKWLYHKDNKVTSSEVPLQVACREFVKPLENELIELKRQLQGDPWLEANIKEYPEGCILYGGRSLPFSKTPVQIPVSVLITPTDWQIIDDLKKWGLFQTGEDPETLIPKIYKQIFKSYYKYEYDKNVWGTEEVWEFPFESRTRFGKGIDCDSWAIVQLSYYRAAGVPRGYAWVVAGMTALGGHATVYVKSKVDDKSHHLNSTYGGVLFDKVSQYPTHKDALEGKDKIGISQVWFSFDDGCSRYTFSTGALPKELNKLKFKGVENMPCGKKKKIKK
jgi:hypothetical protein